MSVVIGGTTGVTPDGSSYKEDFLELWRQASPP